VRGETGSEQRCREVVDHVLNLMKKAQPGVDPGEQSIIRDASVPKCREEALSDDQAACVLSATTMQGLMMSTCPAMTGKKPDWYSALVPSP
jgi:hypothetical protein